VVHRATNPGPVLRLVLLPAKKRRLGARYRKSTNLSLATLASQGPSEHSGAEAASPANLEKPEKLGMTRRRGRHAQQSFGRAARDVASMANKTVQNGQEIIGFRQAREVIKKPGTHLMDRIQLHEIPSLDCQSAFKFGSDSVLMQFWGCLAL
jgi:hypothetical protein